MDEAVLAELRAIRTEIHDLAQQVGLAATREDLKQYVTQETFETVKAEHERRLDGWRGWLPIVLSGSSLAWIIFWSTVGQHLVLR